MFDTVPCCFNLVIENLLISTLGGELGDGTDGPFQSRNRESSYFNDSLGDLDEIVIAQFQSRNRESSYFN